MIQSKVPLFDQKPFRAVVVGGVGLTMSVMLASLAWLRGRDASGFIFGWTWWSVAWAAFGAGLNWSFWQSVWRAESSPTKQNKFRVAAHLFAVLLIGVGAFLYPVRFLDTAKYLPVARGLFTAVFFLGSVGLMLYKIGHGLFAQNLRDGQAE
jgi:hypothetical protein